MIGHNCNDETRPFLLSGTIDAVIHQDMTRIAKTALDCLLGREAASPHTGDSDRDHHAGKSDVSMTRKKFEQLAQSLAAAWRDGTHSAAAAGRARVPRRGATPMQIQDRMADMIGGRVAGWKVGATVRAVQIFEGHDAPLPGRIFADRLFDSPARVSSQLFRGAKSSANSRSG